MRRLLDFGKESRFAIKTLLLAGLSMAVFGAASPANSQNGLEAAFTICSDNDKDVWLAIGYKSGADWKSEGWWSLAPGACHPVLLGRLNQRYVYVHAADEDGVWEGNISMCVKDKEFTLRVSPGSSDCLSRGYDEVGFVEVDTGGASSYEFHLKPENHTPY